jgi:hypothetical protein
MLRGSGLALSPLYQDYGFKASHIAVYFIIMSETNGRYLNVYVMLCCMETLKGAEEIVLATGRIQQELNFITIC